MTQNTKPDLPQYSRDRFVNRDEEIQVVVDSARVLATGGKPKSRTFVFVGERGIGKSWLLKRLGEKLRDIENIDVFDADLRDVQDEAAIAELVKTFGTEMQVQSIEDATLQEVSRQVLGGVLPLGRPLVLLLDTVFEADWNVLAHLEDYFLGPLALDPKMLIVLAGRGRAYPWKTPELRLSARFVRLSPIKGKHAEAQLEKHFPKEVVERSQSILELSGGNPLATHLLAQHEDPLRGLDQVIGQILDTIPEEDERNRVRQYLEALCVLRCYDEDQIDTMLTAYRKGEAEGVASIDGRDVHRALLKWGFSNWDHEKRAYVISDPVNNIVERYVRNQKPDRWRELHRAALELYKEWAEKYDPSWKEEADYHARQIKKSNPAPVSHPQN